MKYRLTHKIQTKAQHRPTAPLIRPSEFDILDIVRSTNCHE